jgi:Tfp pilus assembly protein PilO
MNPLFGAGTAVAATRVLREHRAALVPLVIVLAINAVVLGVVVLPLSQRVAANQTRADAAERTQTAATAEFKQAQSIRDGKARASTDLEKFYKEVLPTDVAAARRMTHLRFQQKAREHGVQFQRGATGEEQLRESVLDRLTVSMTLSGDYDDIRALIYDLETSPDFFVIDNMALTEGGDPNAPLTLAMEVSTYFRTDRVPVAQAGTNGR